MKRGQLEFISSFARTKLEKKGFHMWGNSWDKE
jgi:hypothetical protein